MNRNIKISLLALPLALAVSACGDKETAQEKQEQQVQAATIDQPGMDGQPATPSEARSEAITLAGHIASGDLGRADAEVALEDLSRLINDNIADFPKDMQPTLIEDIQSAQSALEADDMGGLQEAAVAIQNKISGSTTEADAG